VYVLGACMCLVRVCAWCVYVLGACMCLVDLEILKSVQYFKSGYSKDQKIYKKKGGRAANPTP